MKVGRAAQNNQGQDEERRAKTRQVETWEAVKNPDQVIHSVTLWFAESRNWKSCLFPLCGFRLSVLLFALSLSPSQSLSASLPLCRARAHSPSLCFPSCVPLSLLCALFPLVMGDGTSNTILGCFECAQTQNVPQKSKVR